MVEMHNDSLVFSFPDQAPGAKLEVIFKKALRLPEDGGDYPIPPGYPLSHGLGVHSYPDKFPLEHIEDYKKNLPGPWLSRSGVMLPMYQSEAMRVSFYSQRSEKRHQDYFFAVKIAAGKINVVNGLQWKDGLSDKPQDYLVVPAQSSLDGYFVKPGFVRQFVAMPLGRGFSAEGQLTGHEITGGLQIIVYPMKWDVFDRMWPVIPPEPKVQEEAAGYASSASTPMYCRMPIGMGLAPGGLIPQELHEDEFEFNQWDHETSSRCFVHLVNSEDWETITGKYPPTRAPGEAVYSKHGLPWLDEYNDHEPAPNTGVMGRLKSIFQMHRKHRGPRIVAE